MKRSLLALALAVPASLFAQAVSTILGTVTDSAGGLVPRAKISVTSSGTGLKRDAVSNQVGNYLLPALPPGLYTIEAEMEGFRKKIIKGDRKSTRLNSSHSSISYAVF